MLRLGQREVVVRVTDRLQSTQTTDATSTVVTTTYSWDQNGRLVQKATPAQITQYTWRSDDRLIKVVSAVARLTVAVFQAKLKS